VVGNRKPIQCPCHELLDASLPLGVLKIGRHEVDVRLNPFTNQGQPVGVYFWGHVWNLSNMSEHILRMPVGRRTPENA